MRELNDLCTQIQTCPSSIVDIDWAEETGKFNIKRMHDIVLALNDEELINSVIALIEAEWNVLLSQNDPRCFNMKANGEEEIKFPCNTSYLNEPLYTDFCPIHISTHSISGVLYCCKLEVMRKLLPLIEQRELKKRLSAQFSRPNEQEQTTIQSEKTIPNPVTLCFFDKSLYKTSDEQQKLREVLQKVIIGIDTTNGRDWFVIYAAYRYVQNLNAKKLEYVNFFSDIEALLPNELVNLNYDAKGNKRYKKYTDLLSREVNKWYVDCSKLPPINNLVYTQFHFLCPKERFENFVKIIKSLFKELKKLEDDLRKEKSNPKN